MTEHNDPLLDAIALAEADIRHDEPGLAAVVRNCDLAEVTLVLCRLLALMQADRAAGGHVCEECWRPWALAAMRRT